MTSLEESPRSKPSGWNHSTRSLPFRSLVPPFALHLAVCLSSSAPSASDQHRRRHQPTPAPANAAVVSSNISVALQLLLQPQLPSSSFVRSARIVIFPLFALGPACLAHHDALSLCHRRLRRRLATTASHPQSRMSATGFPLFPLLWHPVQSTRQSQSSTLLLVSLHVRFVKLRFATVAALFLGPRQALCPSGRPWFFSSLSLFFNQKFR
ncbi:uncharacterized protein PV09_05985 [Verruconis gallopava]|uniref:Uncharacterized protein n=1 Tax=Verruconis gallopava TaxID=253628 RepID=A0A0D2AUV6_9PEZI|nr:uncharacterized protein PV09_05985 [Verruconis gallopava]KIW02939.1 hypothetical protein PV09_05985 [Verruconis gallopava]